MSKIVKTRRINNYDFTLRYWPSNNRPYVLYRMDIEKARKNAIKSEQIATFKTLKEAEKYLDEIK